MVKIEFVEKRAGTITEYGPFRYAELSYNTLRIDDGEEIASFAGVSNSAGNIIGAGWVLMPARKASASQWKPRSEDMARRWTDIVICAADVSAALASNGLGLNDFEWTEACRLAYRTATRVPFPSLIMAAYHGGDLAYRAGLERGFPGIGAEHDRLVRRDRGA